MHDLFVINDRFTDYLQVKTTEFLYFQLSKQSLLQYMQTDIFSQKLLIVFTEEELLFENTAQDRDDLQRKIDHVTVMINVLLATFPGLCAINNGSNEKQKNEPYYQADKTKKEREREI